MAEFLDYLLNKRGSRSSASSDDSINSPEAKRSKKYDSPSKVPEREEDEILTALKMSEELVAKVQKILEKLKKLDTIEIRTTDLETFKEEAKKDINDLKDGANFTGKQL